MKKLIFVHLPKTGGTMLRQLLDELESATWSFQLQMGGRYTTTGANAHDAVGNFYEKDVAYKFGFVRNPFDWYVSRYHYFIKKQEVEKGVSKGSDLGLYGEDFCKKVPSFKDHIMYGTENNKNNNFWMSQLYEKMFYHQGQLYMDYIGKLENIQQDINKVLENCSIPFNVDIEEFNKFSGNSFVNSSKHDHYSTYYDKETIDIIKHKDEIILDTYNYMF